MAGRCTASVGVSRLAVHERRQPRAAMIVVNGDREELRAVTIEQREHYLQKPGRRLRRGDEIPDDHAAEVFTDVE